MNKSFSDRIKPFLPYILAVLGFIVVAYLYTPQVLQKKIVNQSDISSWKGMANEIVTYNEEHPEDKALWTNSMFSGMPATSISVIYDGDLTDPIYKFLFLGERPASYLLISLIGGFLLFLAFGVNIWLAILGAIAITFCSYNMQIIQVGHNSKMVAIAFMPWVLAAVIYAYKNLKKEGWIKPVFGGLLFALALNFQIKANHPQITYYLAIIILGYAIAQLVLAYKEKLVKKYFILSFTLLGFGLLGIGSNVNHLWPTYEYSKYTMRGENILQNETGVETGGLDIDYATSWSYGINETPNLMIPNFNGGASYSELSKKSNSWQALRNYQGANQMIKQMPTYWGPQPFTAGPMYMGAISIFLFIFGLIYIRGAYKWWIAGVSLLALFLSWGSHFMIFSEFFFKYIPLYNKFRTVSMILVILQITIPVLGVLLVNNVLYGGATGSLSTEASTSPADKKRLKNAFLIALGITGGVSLLLALFPSIAGSFTSYSDGNWPKEIARALVEDRKALLRADAFRSLLFICTGAGTLWLGYMKKLKPQYSIMILATLILVDLWTVDKRYLNASHFVSKTAFNNQFTPRNVDRMILQDQDPHYRVLDVSVNTFNDAYISYHHKTIGGYGAAKLQRYQDMIDYHISREMREFSQNLSEVKTIGDAQESLSYYPVLSMLNTKYIVIGADYPPLENTYRLGNAWFIEEVITVDTPNEEILMTGQIDPSKTAIILSKEFPTPTIEKVSGQISLTSYSPNTLTYSSSSLTNQLAVFSEVWYPAGWEAYIDGKKVDILRANYILRALEIPAGDHEIVFTFAPKSFSQAAIISYICSAILLIGIIAIVSMYLVSRRKRL